MKMLLRLYRDTSGATMVEYGLMVSLIAIVCVVGIFPRIADGLNGIFNTAAGKLNSGS
jgi:pilus assembly protein Flp/PilA